MKLHSIEIVGFKTFAERTKIQLDDELTAVVGPNGCGKSNIIDAIKWVVSERNLRQIRADQNDDVIFKGASTRAPLAYASVTLFFTHCLGHLPGELSQYAELSITRQIDRTGQSNYAINNTPCRRKDIMALFSGTGLGGTSYAIIGQGMISKMIEAKPDALREAIEEASGIGQCKLRKTQALKKLAQAQDNSDRLLDIVNELGAQLQHVTKQAEHAKRYQSLKEKLRNMQVAHLRHEWQIEAQAIGKRSLELNNVLAQIKQISTQLAKDQNDLERKRVQLNQINKKNEGNDQALFQSYQTVPQNNKKTDLNDKLINILKNNINKYNEIIDKKEIEKERLHVEIKDLQATTPLNEKKSLELTEAIKEVKKNVSIAKKNQSKAEKECQKARAGYQQANEKLHAWETRKQWLNESKLTKHSELKEIKNKENMDDIQVLKEAAFSSAKKSYDSHLLQLESIENELAIANSQHEDAMQTSKRTQQICNILQARLVNHEKEHALVALLSKENSKKLNLLEYVFNLISEEINFFKNNINELEDEYRSISKAENTSEDHNYAKRKHIVLSKLKKRYKHKIATINAAFDEIMQSNAVNRTQLDSLNTICQDLKIAQQTSMERQKHIVSHAETIVGRELNWEPSSSYLIHHISAFSKEMDTLSQHIKKCGPINLAAIEEQAQIKKRFVYLSSQHDDLIQSVKTLKEAIQSIDNETKQKFKSAYLHIAQTFSHLFSQLFRGGQANLNLLSDNWLESGIAITAQPPGKKNTSIHLLSGGEKTLTAIALLFAIFSYNPAPFCLLDEVDAALDDQNIQRFNLLLQQMVKRVQMLVISHHKHTLSVANKLIGITMREPGVSRQVSVNINQALSMAEKVA